MNYKLIILTLAFSVIHYTMLHFNFKTNLEMFQYLP